MGGSAVSHFERLTALDSSFLEIEDQNAKLKEKQVSAPKDATLPGILTDTVGSLETAIGENTKRIEANRAEIKAAKTEIFDALKKAGVELAPEQVDLLLDSVLSGDLVRLVAVFNAAKLIDSLPELGGQLVALYPEKYVFDMPGFPKVLAKDLAQGMVQQVRSHIHP